MSSEHVFQLAHSNAPWEHSHDFSHGQERESEQRTLWVALLTAAMMVVEIAAGLMWNSMALLADGWHMSTHAAALGISYFAYRFARRHRADPRYSFGTGKVHGLASYTSAVLLAFVALYVISDSLRAIWSPKRIEFEYSLIVAVVGLAVNLVSIKLLHMGPAQDHGHSHAPGEHHDHGPASDINRSAAFAHVVVDSMTSALAVVALLAGKYFGWVWLDPLVGLIGGAIIAQWSWHLIRQAMPMLLDRTTDSDLRTQVAAKIAEDGDSSVADFHAWQVAPGRMAAILSIVAHAPRSTEFYRARLAPLGFAHLSVEINTCKRCP